MDIVELALRTTSRRSPKIIRGTLQHILPNKSRSQLVKQLFQLLKKMATKIITTDEYPTYLGSLVYEIFRKCYLFFFGAQLCSFQDLSFQESSKDV